MSDTLITLIFKLVSTLGAAAIAIFGAMQMFNTYNDRKLKESIEKAKESSVGAKAVGELLAGQQQIREDISEIEKKIGDIKDDMYKEKKDLQERLEKLRNHFDDMTKDYLKIFTNR